MDYLYLKSVFKLRRLHGSWDHCCCRKSVIAADILKLLGKLSNMSIRIVHRENEAVNQQWEGLFPGHSSKKHTPKEESV